MAAQHTPGPWGVQDDHGRRYVETLQGNDDTICEVHKRDKKGEQAANAILIAASPELLTWLRLFLPQVPEESKATWQYEQALATLAKATGGEG